LAKKLTTKWQNLHKNTLNLSNNEAFKKAKESIVTAYLNYVYFGNHAYGVDAAARHYFHTSAKDLTILQSAILASMPQAPSLYNPIIDPTIVL
jgi:membrane peptidoglycan carboxypeptidase